MASQGPYGRQGFQSNPSGYGGSDPNSGYGANDYSSPQYGGASYGGGAGYGATPGYGADSSYSTPPMAGAYGADYAPYGSQVSNDYEVRNSFVSTYS
jgi:hypothetical protein